MPRCSPRRRSSGCELVGVVLSGRNIDTGWFAQVLAGGVPNA
ncbi:hypothetical protein [Sinisalibacter aestuarii]|nr:hypothetical protein [Sinisalibacter aestuarii]